MKKQNSGNLSELQETVNLKQKQIEAQDDPFFYEMNDEWTSNNNIE